MSLPVQASGSTSARQLVSASNRERLLCRVACRFLGRAIRVDGSESLRGLLSDAGAVPAASNGREAALRYAVSNKSYHRGRV